MRRNIKSVISIFVRWISGLLFLLIASCGNDSAKDSQKGYSVTILGDTEQNSAVPKALNAAGQVAGNIYTQDYRSRAILLFGNTTTDLSNSTSTSSEANSINNSGQTVGTATTNGETHATLFDHGSVIDLGTLGGKYSTALGINNTGTIVGYSRKGDNFTYRAFIYSNNSMQELGTLGGNFSYAYDINDSGQAAGSSSTSNYLDHATLFDNGTVTDLDPQGIRSAAYSINNIGQAVGYTNDTYGKSHAALFSNGKVTLLGELGTSNTSAAYSINNHGQVVGVFWDAAGSPKAFLYYNGTLTDLTSAISEASGWNLLEARDINDSGQIVGYASKNVNGTTVYNAILLTPN